MAFKELKKRLDEIFPSGEEYVLQDNVPLLSESWNKSDADLMIRITKDDTHYNFAVLVKTSQSTENNINTTYAKKVVKKMVNEYGFWIGLVWDGKSILKYDPTYDEFNTGSITEELSGNSKNDKKSKSWMKIDYDDIVKLKSEFLESKIQDDFISKIKSELGKLKSESNNNKYIIPIITDWFDKLSYKDLLQKDRTVSVSLAKQFELIYSILKLKDINISKGKDESGNKESLQLCRYSSMGALRRILLEGKESMCGLACMNDKSEGFFLDKCLTGDSYNLYRKPQRLIDEYNNAFILSLCDINKSDDLTMWRFYGCDCQGVCLHYTINLEKIQNSEEFFLMPICYGKENNPLVSLFKILRKLPFIGSLKFELTHKHIWRLFVKPYDFNVEKEYRLIYIPPSKSKSDQPKNNQQKKENILTAVNKPVNPTLKWILNDGCGIFHPLQEFISNTHNDNSIFPLKLTKVILGPKYSEALVNKVQLKSYLHSSQDLNDKSIEIGVSTIDFYR